MKNVEKKQISLVLETRKNFDELEMIVKIKKFIEGFKDVEVVGTHIKVFKNPIDKRGNEKNIQGHYHN